MQEMVMKKKKSKIHLSSTRKIALSFVGVIIVGSILLSLNIANNGAPRSFLDNLFVATSATCVTGLVPAVTVEQYSLFGQLVIVAMIQIGGLGFLTFLGLFLSKIKRKLSLNSKLVMQEALNQPSMNELAAFVKKIIVYTFVVEGIGMICLSTVFIPEFQDVGKGLYYAFFHSISAFCNAGFDILGSTSLISYQSNIIMNITITSLIVLGGLGFIVWFDIAEKFTKERKRVSKFSIKHLVSSFELHTKIVLVATALLLALGMGLFLICEYTNPLTIGELSLFDKLQTSYFQSVTLRTAGFATVDMFSLRTYTKLFMCIFMFIGGSPAGTAGGIKTVTFAVVCLLIYNIYHGRTEVTVYKRRLKKRLVIRSLAIFTIAIAVALSGLFVLSITEQLPFIDIMFETFSAFGTVGLSANVTPLLSDAGKVVIILLMYMGRIGPVTLLISFVKKSGLENGKAHIRYIDEDVLLG